MIASLIISIVAVIISLFALYKNWRTQTRQIEIEEAREKDRIHQGKKASLVAHIHKELEAQQMHRTIWKYILRVENKGLAEARNIKLLLDGKPIMEHDAILKDQDEVTQIGAQSHFDYTMVLTLNTVFPSKAEITWTDDSGEPGSYKTTLTMP